MQARSREAWDRIVQAGLDILIAEGREGVTIQAVCQRAAVSPSSIYARVDGITELFWAIYERGFEDVRLTYRQAFALAAKTPQGSRDRVEAVAAAMWQTYHDNLDFLRPIVRQAAIDEVLRAQGPIDSAPFVEQMAVLLDSGDPVAANDAARMLIAEGNMRTIFGEGFHAPPQETDEEFVARVARTAWGRLRST